MRALQEWVKDNPKVQLWAARLSRKSEQTSQVFVGTLYNYWTRKVSKEFKTLESWTTFIREQAKDEDNDVRVTWGRDLESWLLGYVSDKTGRNLTDTAKATAFAAVKNWLIYRLTRASASLPTRLG